MSEFTQHVRDLIAHGLTVQDVSEFLHVHPRYVREVLSSREPQEIPPHRFADALLRAPVLLDEDQHG